MSTNTTPSRRATGSPDVPPPPAVVAEARFEEAKAITDALAQRLRRDRARCRRAADDERVRASRQVAATRMELDDAREHELRSRDALVIVLSEAGSTAAEVSAVVGCSRRTVSKVRQAHGFRSPRFLGPEQLARIEEKLDDGWSFIEIERTLGHDAETIARHFPGRGWTREQMNDFNHVLRVERENAALVLRPATGPRSAQQAREVHLSPPDPSERLLRPASRGASTGGRRSA